MDRASLLVLRLPCVPNQISFNALVSIDREWKYIRSCSVCLEVYDVHVWGCDWLLLKHDIYPIRSGPWGMNCSWLIGQQGWNIVTGISVHLFRWTSSSSSQRMVIQKHKPLGDNTIAQTFGDYLTYAASWFSCSRKAVVHHIFFRLMREPCSFRHVSATGFIHRFLLSNCIFHEYNRVLQILNIQTWTKMSIHHIYRTASILTNWFRQQPGLRRTIRWYARQPGHS